MDERLVLILHKTPNHITIQTPARICLFGDHQDYLGLPIIACAITKYMTFDGIKNSKPYFEIVMPNIQEVKVIPLENTFETAPTSHDFLLAGLRVAKRYGGIPSEGYSVTITSDIPINAGVSSSSAVTVGWIHFLLKAFGCNQEITSEFIAKLAYEAEVLEHHSPGGKMDQYTIALGNTLYLETGANTHFQNLGSALNGLILAESGISKETLGMLKNTRELAEKAIRQVKEFDSKFDIETATISAISKYVSVLDNTLFPYFEAAIENHQITRQALSELQQANLHLKVLGELMTKHHTILKEKLHVSHPKIDGMLEATLNAGAYGGKIVGSGGGGCAVVLASDKNTEAVLKALKNAGAKDAYQVSISQGSIVKNEA
ncbi:MAG: galactokinase family protein [Flavobacteriaceae bacterium]